MLNYVYNIKSCINAQEFIIVNHVHNTTALLPRLYVLKTANILPSKYNGTNIVVAGSSIVKLNTALAIIRTVVSTISA